ncbi:helix-turn-helix domain-containing protein [Lacticaseibacillus sp. 866-1]|uniref:helix-turn-helix domain-containing protein n=1 Tax=Lacticaseibacillus sp. 866-1 TaxID=2799576 RepID=UPI0019459463|nr:helix-turn-helix domain-containing protein [Lacticaseibacillus sp. 866-1]
MNFETIFLEKADLQKFTMFQTLVTNQTQSLSITDLAERLALSYQQSYNVFQELTRDLVELSRQPAGKIKQALTDGAALNLSIDDYRLFLLNSSIAFQFVDYLVQGNQQSVSHFCGDHYISRSTLMRKTALVRSFLSGFKVKISLTQATFVGDEKQVRLFLQLFYWLSYHGSRWPFRALDFDRLSAQYRSLPSADQDPITASQERLFWGVCRTRMSRGHFVSLNAGFSKSIPQGEFSMTAVYPSKPNPNVPQAALDAETIFFYFFQQKTIRFTPPAASTMMMCNYLEQTSSPAAQVVAGLPAAVRQDSVGQTDPFEDPVLHANLMRVTAAFYLMEGNFVKQSDFFKPSLPNYMQKQARRTLSRYIDSLPDRADYQTFKRAKRPLVEMLFYLLVPYLRDFQWQELVKVKLVMETTDTVNRNIIDFVRNLSVVELLGDDAPLEQADLLITALDDFVDPVALSALPKRIAKFNWYLDATDGDYQTLFETVFKLFQQKLIASGN